jgi:hypothetical protein
MMHSFKLWATSAANPALDVATDRAGLTVYRAVTSARPTTNDDLNTLVAPS